MPHHEIQLRTDDGTCTAHVFRPDAGGPWPGVLVYMDGLGIRPAMLAVAERLAAAGYYALLPDLFYRSGPYSSPDPVKLFSDPEVRSAWAARFTGTITIPGIMRDTRACLDHLAAQPDVRQPHVGTTGYCMGGRFSLAAAGHFPDRIAAAASYHGGNLAADVPDSPHLLAADIQAEVYVAGATADSSFPDEHRDRLEQALTAAGVRHTIETYPARHGWVLSDMPVHDPAAAERHWDTLLALFARTLR
jgi:carboxymethylenebutenolidase